MTRTLEILATFALTVGLACGGSSSTGRDGSADLSSPGSGGVKGSGGSAGAGGRTGSGGTSGSGGGAGSGGFSGGGGASGSGGVAGSGGVIGSGGSGSNPKLVLAVGIPDAAGAAALVAEHNAARHGALNPIPSPALPDLTWDPLLAQVANAWGQKCESSSGTLLDHNPNRSSDYVALGGSGVVGENIFATTGNVTVGGAVGLWMEEAADYTYSTNSCAAQCGHYTQIVWRSTTRVGCAVVSCPALQFPKTLICDYSPAGNYVGQRPY